MSELTALDVCVLTYSSSVTSEESSGFQLLSESSFRHLES